MSVQIRELNDTDSYNVIFIIIKRFRRIGTSAGGQNQPTTQRADVLLPDLEFVFPHIFFSGQRTVSVLVLFQRALAETNYW